MCGYLQEREFICQTNHNGIYNTRKLAVVPMTTAMYAKLAEKIGSADIPWIVSGSASAYSAIRGYWLCSAVIQTAGIGHDAKL